MSKRQLVIVSIVLSVIFLVYVILDYFGWTRYLTLCCSSTEGYVSRYSSLPKASRTRVVVTFTTTPKRAKKLRPMVNSILDQSVKVDMIGLCLPYKYKKHAPKFIKDVANIFPAGKNHGQGTSLIPMLLREKEADTMILALRDDVVYGRDFVASMVEAAEEHSESVIADKRDWALLVRPRCYDSSVISKNEEKLDLDWFRKHAKQVHLVEFGQTYGVYL